MIFMLFEYHFIFAILFFPSIFRGNFDTICHRLFLYNVNDILIRRLFLFSFLVRKYQ